MTQEPPEDPRSGASPIQLGPVRCPVCFTRHWWRVPETCSRCGSDLERPADPDRGDDGERTRDGRLRFLLVIGCTLITFAGMIFRRLPESDPGRAARAKARNECRDAMDALMTRKFDLAAQAAQDAVNLYERFPEARTVMALAHIGQGRYRDAVREALWAEGDFADGRQDPAGFRDGIAIDRVATRARCVAEAAADAEPAVGPALFETLLTVSGAPSCTEARSALDNATASARAVMARAAGACPDAFSCTEQAREPAPPKTP